MKESEMTDIDKIARRFGGISVDGVEYVWDYENNKRWKKSDLTHRELNLIEKKRYEYFKN